MVEAGSRLPGVDEYLAAHEEVLSHLPDPGHRQVADTEVAAAQVDAPDDVQPLSTALYRARRDQQLFPHPFDVEEILAQAIAAPIGTLAPNLLAGDGDELHIL